jgi:transposase
MYEAARYIAPRELRDLRDLLRQRFVLTQMRTALKNRVHALIARQGIQHGHTRLLGPAGRVFLCELELRPEPRARLDVLLRLIGDFDPRSTRSPPKSTSAPGTTNASRCSARSAASAAISAC